VSTKIFRRSKVKKNLKKTLFLTFDLLKNFVDTTLIRRLKVSKLYLDSRSPEKDGKIMKLLIS
jgi:hypothetical protein